MKKHFWLYNMFYITTILLKNLSVCCPLVKHIFFGICMLKKHIVGMASFKVAFLKQTGSITKTTAGPHLLLLVWENQLMFVLKQ